jgi:hypothetical protein
LHDNKAGALPLGLSFTLEGTLHSGAVAPPQSTVEMSESGKASGKEERDTTAHDVLHEHRHPQHIGHILIYYRDTAAPHTHVPTRHKQM